MIKRGRPSIPKITYESFVEVWEQLQAEGRASINAVQNTLGGVKSTIGAYRERYEREKSGKELSLIKGIELTEALQQAIAAIKVKEIDALEQENQQLKSRLDESLSEMQKVEEDYASLKVELEETKTDLDEQKQRLERQLAITEVRFQDSENREKQLSKQCQELSEQISQHRQEAAVAKKEVEILREQAKNTEIQK